MPAIPIVYTLPDCGQCIATKAALRASDIHFVEVNLEAVPLQATTLRDAGFTSAPIVVVPGMEPWQGFRPDLIAQLLDPPEAAA